MPTCVVVLSAHEAANQLIEKLQEARTPLRQYQLVEPMNYRKAKNSASTEQVATKIQSFAEQFPTRGIDEVQLLNPKLSRQISQRRMATWLMPFGFIAGLTFAQMTNLHTFSELGFDYLPEPIAGGLLGMFSGWIGSYTSTSGINNKNNEDITSLRKISEKGLWLVILETPLEVELPWQLIKVLNPVEIVRLSDL